MHALIDSTENCKIACLSEHWSLEANLHVLPGYKLISSFCRPPDQRGGGVAIFCHNDLNAGPVEGINDFSSCGVFECCGALIQTGRESLLVTCVYVVPPVNHESLLDRFNNLLDFLSNKKCDYIVAGDFNINILLDNRECKDFLDLIKSFDCVLAVSEPTRKGGGAESCLDNIITNIKRHYLVENIFTGISDHSAQILTLYSECNEKGFILRRLFFEKSISEFCHDIQSEHYNRVFLGGDVNQKYGDFANTFLRYFYKHFPLKHVKLMRSKRPLYLNDPEITRCRNNMTAYQVMSHDFPHLSPIYKHFKSTYHNLLNEARLKYYQNMFDKSQNKSKTSWQIINDIVGNNKLCHSNTVCPDLRAAANSFNNYFSTVASDLVSQRLPATFTFDNSSIPINDVSFFITPVTIDELNEVIRKFEPKKSFGYDEVPMYLVKKCFDYISSPLCEIINSSLSSGIYPDSLKFASIQPIFKKGDRGDIQNYRPISLMSVFSKFFEVTMYSRLVGFFKECNLFSQSQHGFLAGKSIDTAIYELTSEIYSTLDNNGIACGIFLDLSRAFDCIDFNILISKLERYGIRGIALEWFKSYLHNRKQIVRLFDSNSGMHLQSDALGVSMGVPQGSILGPLLFIIFMNDFAAIANENKIVVNYADDTTLLVNAKTFPEVVTLSDEFLTAATSWFVNSRLLLNHSKTSLLFFKTSQSLQTPSNLKLQKEVLQFSDSARYLGIQIDETLRFKQHVDSLCVKLSQVCYGLRVLRNNTCDKLVKSFYFANFYSRLRYGVIFWGSAPEATRIFLKQKWAVRIICRLKFSESCRGHFRHLRLLTFTAVYIFECIRFLYNNRPKFCNNRLLTAYNSRYAADYSFPIHNLSLFERSAFYSCMKLYNKLPKEIKLFDDFRHIKGRLFNLLCDLEPYNLNEFLER